MSEQVFHIIGHAGRQSSAAFVTLYLADRFGTPHTHYSKSAFRYRQTRAMDGRIFGYEIGVEIGPPLSNVALEREHEMLEACRAFLAALGEMDVWA